MSSEAHTKGPAPPPEPGIHQAGLHIPNNIKDNDIVDKHYKILIHIVSGYTQDFGPTQILVGGNATVNYTNDVHYSTTQQNIPK